MLSAAWHRLRDNILSLHEQVRTEHRQPMPIARRESVVLITSAILLVIYFYYGKPSYFRDKLYKGLLEGGSFEGIEPIWHGLFGYGYWAVISVVLRILIPMLVVVLIFHERPRDYGFRLRGTWRHAWIYALLFAGMLPILYLASLDPSFQAKYPFYKPAAQGGWHFVLYELAYGTQFLALEAFFRGFMLFGLERRFGYYAIVIMAVPYCMVHFGKPMPETLAAIAAAFILGYLALKTRSIYFGAALHWGVGITMDLLAILQRPAG